MKIKAGLEKEWEEAKLKNSEDFYSKGVLDFTERWVDLMEKKVGQGSIIKDIFKDTSHEADTDGITGFMYGAAASMISYFWAYGDEFRTAYNADFGVGPEETGTVNPAVVTIAGDKE